MLLQQKYMTSYSIPQIKLSRRHSRSSNFPIISSLKSCNGSKLLRSGKGMDWYHEMKLEVQNHECNMFGVVSEASYAHYCEHGQCKLAERFGTDIDSICITEISLKFIAPLRHRDKFLLKVRVYDYSDARLCFEALIFKLPNLEPILEEKSTVVWLDKDGRPTRVPPRMISYEMRAKNQDD